MGVASNNTPAPQNEDKNSSIVWNIFYRRWLASKGKD